MVRISSTLIRLPILLVLLLTFQNKNNLLQKRLFRKGNTLTILVCGEKGTGKHSFINNLCNSNHFDESAAEMHSGSILQFRKHEINIREPNAMPITLNTVFTPGFRCGLDNSAVPNKIVEYLETQFNLVLEEEIRIKRNPRHEDNRVHAIIYFVRATAKGLDAFDIACMKKLGARSNLIPVISKADSLNEEELKLNKMLIQNDIIRESIQVYKFNDSLSKTEPVQSSGIGEGDRVDDEDEEDDGLLADNGSRNSDLEIQLELDRLQSMIPFAIMCSSETALGSSGNVREFPWGVLDVDQAKNSDFTVLKSILLTTHIQELKDSTNQKIYESYRSEKLESNIFAR